MRTTLYPMVQFKKDTWEIDEFDCASIFLLIGTEKAMRDVFEAASASGQKIVYCETGKGNLEKVFAGLDSERKERGE